MQSHRRIFLRQLSAVGISLGGGLTDILAAGIAPGLINGAGGTPNMPSGIMSSDLDGERAIIWSRCDRPARMWVDYATQDSFANARRVRGPDALADTDFTARIELEHLPRGQTIVYRVRFEDLAAPGTYSAPLTGSFTVPSMSPADDLVFTFSGDEAGQDFGINPDIGGYQLYETMRRHQPDFFIHSGDQIYADGPLDSAVSLDDGRIWHNIVTPAKAQVAQSLDDYRGNFAYNLLDESKRRFVAEVPMLVQWDDHEVRNNWYPGQIIDDPRYDRERRASVLATYANRALREYNPLRIDPKSHERIYRAFDLGPMIEVFMLDLRSYRGPPGTNIEATPSASARLLGDTQLRWLEQRLAASTATWKIIACDMPISLVIPDPYPGDPTTTFEGIANADNGGPSGRELAIARLLRFIATNKIVNIVWVTADVHYPSAIHYAPERAAMADFLPFWEFVAGPINAGTFGPNALDATFGPEVRFQRVPEKLNRSPLDGLQFFGLGRIDKHTRALTVSLRDVADSELFSVELSAA